MGIITKYCKDQAVYWGTPTVDGYGGLTFATPVEVDCRWEEIQELFVDVTGKSVLSKSVVYSASDFDFDGYLYNGDLDDLSAAQKANPKLVAAAYPIRGKSSIPSLNNMDTVRKVWL